MSDKQIQDWQEKIRASFGQESKLYEYLFETMNNFYYRYLETTTDKNLKTIELGPKYYGARSREVSMVDALKLTNPVAKKGIIELAKAFPKGQGPAVEYELSVLISNLGQDKGKLTLKSSINWGFPDFSDQGKMFVKMVVFEYAELSQFRKELAQKLEEVCEAFL
jgi:hypothetical protein